MEVNRKSTAGCEGYENNDRGCDGRRCRCGSRLIKCKYDLVMTNTELTLTFSMGAKSEQVETDKM
jgi:hypothetical protein